MKPKASHPTGARSFPLRVHITTAFVALTSAMGALTVYHTYQAGAHLVFAASEETFTHAASETSHQVRDLLAPAMLQIDLIARHAIAAAASRRDRFEALPFLAAALDGNASVAAVRIGYETGELLEVRRSAQAGADGVPHGAMYVVDEVVQSDARLLAYRSYLDSAFRKIDATEVLEEIRDPRFQRWFHEATAATRIVRTDMSILSDGGVGTSLSRRTASGVSVVAVDLTLETLSARLRSHRLTPSTQIALIDRDGRVIAHPNRDRLVGPVDRHGRPRLSVIFETGEDALGDLYRDAHGLDARLDLVAEGREWIGVARVLLADIGEPVTLLLAVPRDELLIDARDLAHTQVLISLLIVALALPLSWLFSRRLSRPLERLAFSARSIQSFDFTQGAEFASRIVEVDELAHAMDAMRATIRQFLETSAMLGAEHRLDRLLERAVDDTVRVTGARRGSLYLFDEDGAVLVRGGVGCGTVELDEANGTGAEAPFPESVQLAGAPAGIIARTAIDRVTTLENVPSGSRILATPLRNRDGELVGVLALELARPLEGEGQALTPLLAFVEAVSGVAAVAIETRHHVEEQKRLFKSLIELLASAIDAKSPYTGGHCQRVPVIAEMLAHAACNARSGPFRDFMLDDENWETLHLAAWLHDCGKVTTPEYVADKATKLETLCNRIHEVRARFEIIKRDAEITCWKDIAQGAEPARAMQTMQAAWREIDEAFAFIAHCNVGGESMSEADMQRVRRIAARTWTRTLDDRIGLSEAERRRLAGVPPCSLPIKEPLLADRPEHVVLHRPEDMIPADNPWGFKLSPPSHRLDLGEVHCLCVARGTLTPEERHLINDHVVQSAIMLSKLPFPRHLRKVPEVACGHHERIDGTGYPRRLRGEEMSVSARIMAIADVFEALTAADRPYKTGKPLSETLDIMRVMAISGHIDPELFALFVESGVPRRYAEQFLDPAQWDEAAERSSLGAAV